MAIHRKNTPPKVSAKPKYNVQALVPSGRGLWPIEFCLSLVSNVLQLKNDPPPGGIRLDVEVIQSATLQQSRTNLIKKGLANGATHLWLLDDDHIFPGDTVKHMLRVMEAKNVRVLCSNYARRTIPSGPVSRGLDNNLVFTRPDSSGLQEVRYSGLGVTMIRADVFENLPEPWFDFEWHRNKETGEWFIGRSEDVVFFDLLHEKGFKVWLDHDLSKHVEHIGQFAFSNYHAMPPGEMRQYLKKQGEI